MIITNCNELLSQLINIESYIQVIEEKLDRLDIEYDREEILKLIIATRIRHNK